MMKTNSFFNSMKTKLFGDNIKQKQLYEYLYINGNKYNKPFDIYLLTCEQNINDLNAVFILSYKNKLIYIDINSSYLELSEIIANKYNIPQSVIVSLNSFLETNKATFLLYYNEVIGRSETLTTIHP